MRSLPRLDRRLAEQAMERGLGHRPAAESDDRRMHSWWIWQDAHGDRDVARERPAHAHIERLVEDNDVARARESARRNASAGNGRKAMSVTRPIARPSARISSTTSLMVP